MALTFLTPKGCNNIAQGNALGSGHHDFQAESLRHGQRVAPLQGAEAL